MSNSITILSLCKFKAIFEIETAFRHVSVYLIGSDIFFDVRSKPKTSRKQSTSPFKNATAAGEEGDTTLKGLCHRIRKACQWYRFEGFDLDMRCLIINFFLITFLLIFHRQCGIKCVRIALLTFWSISDSWRLSLIGFWFCSFSTIIALFVPWKLLELLYLGSEHRLSRIVSSAYVQEQTRAAPATFNNRAHSNTFRATSN